jgi:membrane-associated protease RseP (regulator of RpoE activity)
MNEYESQSNIDPNWATPAKRRFRLLRPLPHNKPHINIILFVLTIGSTYLLGGPWYCLAVMSILLSHEMGHYLMCRKYKVRATLPFFIPLPYANPFGTMGAVIQMKSPIPSRKALFDIGTAGPLAGLVLTLPAIYFGVQHSEVVETSKIAGSTMILGESLLFKYVTKLAIGPIPEGYDISLHALAYAGWAGLFVTALNLLPVGQLDGGHVMYALFGSNAKHVFTLSLIGFGVCTFFFPGWVLLFALLLFFGYKHPPPVDDFTPLDNGRKFIGAVIFLLFIISFTPIPFKF